MEIFDQQQRDKRELQFWSVVFLLILPFSTSHAIEMNFNTMLWAVKQNAGPIIWFVTAVAYVIGICFIISAIQELKRAGQSQSYMQSQTHMISGPLVKMVIGVLLIYLPSTIDIGVWTLWGHSALGGGAAQYMAYTPSLLDPFAPAKQGAIAIVRVIGYVSFVRGFVILSRTANQSAQPGTFGKGILHVVGGIMAINVVETIRIIGNTLGMTTI